MGDEEQHAQDLLAPYRKTISDTPELLSLLYDADMLPEQVVTVRAAVTTAAVVVAYQMGFRKGGGSVTND